MNLLLHLISRTIKTSLIRPEFITCLQASRTFTGLNLSSSSKGKNITLACVLSLTKDKNNEPNAMHAKSFVKAIAKLMTIIFVFIKLRLANRMSKIKMTKNVRNTCRFRTILVTNVMSLVISIRVVTSFLKREEGKNNIPPMLNRLLLD